MLAEETALDVSACETSLTQFLLLAYHTRSPATGRSLLAFRLHQFIAGAGTLWDPGAARGAVSHAQRPAVQAGRTGQDAVQSVFLPRLWPGVSPRVGHHGRPAARARCARELTERAHEDEEVLFGYVMPDTAGPLTRAMSRTASTRKTGSTSGDATTVKATYRRYRPLPWRWRRTARSARAWPGGSSRHVPILPAVWYRLRRRHAQ